MRLLEIASLLEKNLPALANVNVQQEANGMKLIGATPAGLSSALDELSKVVALRDYVNNIRAHAAVIWSRMESVSFTQPQWNQVQNSVAAARNVGDGLLKAIRQTAPKVDQHTIAFLLPPIPDLPSLDLVIKEIDGAIQQGAGRPPAGEAPPIIRFQGFDTGTAWIYVLMSNWLVGRLLKIVNAAIALAKEKREVEAAHERTRRLKLENDALAEHSQLQAKMAELVKLHIDGHRQQLAKEIDAGLPPDPEQLQRTAFAISTMMNLMTRGMEVYRALPAVGDTATPAKDGDPNDFAAFPKSEDFKELRGEAAPLLAAGDPKAKQ